VFSLLAIAPVLGFLSILQLVVLLASTLNFSPEPLNPCTLRLAPYVLHLVPGVAEPWTLIPEAYTLRFKPSTLYRIPYTLTGSLLNPWNPKIHFSSKSVQSPSR